MISTLIVGAAIAVGQATTPARSWQAIRTPEGTTARVWGWLEGGFVRWFPQEQPAANPAPAAPSHESAQPSLPALNYGVDVAKLVQDRRTIRASDPETLRMVEGGASLDDSERCPRPDPYPFLGRTPDQDTLILTAGLLLAAFVVFLAVRRRQP